MDNISNNNHMQKLYYLSYFLCLFAWMFSNVTFVSNISGIILKISMIPLALLILLQSKKYEKKSVINIILIFVSFVTSWIISKDITLLVLFLFIISSKYIDINKLIDIDWKIKILFMILVYLLYKVGYTEKYLLVRADGLIRSSMGFSHPNVFSSYIFSVFCEYIYSNYKKCNLLIISIISFFTIFTIAYYSDSRGFYYSAFLLYLIILVYKINFKVFKNKIVKLIFKYSIIVFMCISIIVSMKYTINNSFLIRLDEILSGRIKFANYFLNNYPIELFGNKLLLVSTMKARITGESRFILDNSYVKILLQFGVIPLIIFLIYFIKTIDKALKSENYLLVAILFIYSLIGISENVFFRLYGNIFLLYFSVVIFENKDEFLKKEECIEKGKEVNNELAKEKFYI